MERLDSGMRDDAISPQEYPHRASVADKSQESGKSEYAADQKGVVTKYLAYSSHRPHRQQPVQNA
jgi:hypothetical protein